MSEHQVSPEELDNFFAFLQCQLRKQAEVRLDSEVEVPSDRARDIWPKFQEWVQVSLGSLKKSDKWVPFHTVLCSHELFAVQAIHTLDRLDERQRLVVLFIFRAHCRTDLFQKVQLPHIKKKEFWKNPLSSFAENGIITKAMLRHRKAGNSMQTAAFRCIPARLRDDDDENLVWNIALRTCILIDTAEKVWHIVQDESLSADQKYSSISSVIRKGKGLGHTWAKMLMVTVDIAFPRLRLLAERCEVGLGAIGGLERLVPGCCRPSSNHTPAPHLVGQVLERVTAAVNEESSPVASASGFWSLLSEVEKKACSKFKSHNLLLQQMNTPRCSLTPGTVQVQLCEWRQFHDWLAKHCHEPGTNGQAAEAAEAVEAAESITDGDDDAPLTIVVPQAAHRPLPEPCVDSAPIKRPRQEEHAGLPDTSSAALAELSEPRWEVQLAVVCRARVLKKEAEVNQAEAEVKRCLAARSSTAKRLSLALETLHEADQEHKRKMRELSKVEAEVSRVDDEVTALEEEADALTNCMKADFGTRSSGFPEYDSSLDVSRALQWVVSASSSSSSSVRGGGAGAGTLTAAAAFLEGYRSSLRQATETHRVEVENLPESPAHRRALDEQAKLQKEVESALREKEEKSRSYQAAEAANNEAIDTYEEHRRAFGEAEFELHRARAVQAGFEAALEAGCSARVRCDG